MASDKCMLDNARTFQDVSHGWYCKIVIKIIMINAFLVRNRKISTYMKIPHTAHRPLPGVEPRPTALCGIPFSLDDGIDSYNNNNR